MNVKRFLCASLLLPNLAMAQIANLPFGAELSRPLLPGVSGPTLDSGIRSAVSELQSRLPALIPRIVSLDTLGSPDLRALVDTLGTSLPTTGIQTLARELAAQLQPVNCLASTEKTTLAFEALPTAAPVAEHDLLSAVVITCDADANISFSTSQVFTSQLIDNSGLRSHQWSLRVSNDQGTAPAIISVFREDGAPVHQKSLSVPANTPTTVSLKMRLHDAVDSSRTPKQTGELQEIRPPVLYILTARADA